MLHFFTAHKRHLLLQPLLLAVIIAAVYSPAFWAEPCLLDDINLMRSWLTTSQPPLLELFHATNITYYRPLIWASYWLDAQVWGLDPIAMHAENIALHLLNALLVFILSRQLSRPGQAPPSWMPFWAALLFGLHPITTESVAWISGRTDLLACSGLLGSTICLVTWREQQKFWLLIVAALLAVMAGLSKEVAWAFFFGIPFLISAQKRELPAATLATSRKHLYAVAFCIAISFLLATGTVSFWPVLAMALISWGIFHHLYTEPDQRSWKRSGLITLSVSTVLVITLFAGLYLCKKVMLQNPFSPTGLTLITMVTDPDKALQLTSMATAFYVKKFFLPLPLSLSITTINSYYIFGGILILFLIAWLSVMRTITSALALTGILLLVPILPLLFGTIAWAPYAERYLYMPAAFWTIALCTQAASIRNYSHRTIATLVILLLLPCAAWATFTRSVAWQKNLTLFEDTTRKSPHHAESRGGYMIALAQNGQSIQAAQQHRELLELVDGPDEMKYDYNLAYFMYHAGMKHEAYNVLARSTTKWEILAKQKTTFYSAEWHKLHKLQQQIKNELDNTSGEDTPATSNPQ